MAAGAREGSSYMDEESYRCSGSTRKASADTRDFYHQLLLDWRAVSTGIYKVECSCCLLSHIQRNKFHNGMSSRGLLYAISDISCRLEKQTFLDGLT